MMTMAPRASAGSDDVGHVLGPVGGVQQRLGLGGDDSRGIEQQLAQPCTDRRVARLVRDDDLVAALGQGVGQDPELGGLAGALAALEGEEVPASRSQCSAHDLRARAAFVAFLAGAFFAGARPRAPSPAPGRGPGDRPAARCRARR